MKVAFFTNFSSIKAGGLFTYSIGILKLLLNSSEIKKIYLVVHNDQLEYFSQYAGNDKVKLIEINRSKFIIKISYQLSVFLFDTYFIYKKYLGSKRFPQKITGLSNFINPYYRKVKRYKPDLLYFPYQYAQIYGTRLPVITTMHDVQELHFPDFFDPFERIHRTVNTTKSIIESDAVIVSFSHVQNDLIKYFGVEHEKVNVCMPPLTESWFSNDDSIEFSDLKKRFTLPDEYVLYPAATWIHKNHSRLISAIQILKKKGSMIHLVCTGNKTEYYLELEKQIESAGLENQIQFLGIVTESELIGLYKSAAMVIIPTLYEAGSGPLFEAMRYNTPVACSNVTSLPETIDNEKFIFDPYNENEIADIIEKILRNTEFREENIINSKRRLEYYSNINFSESFINVFKNLSVSG